MKKDNFNIAIYIDMENICRSKFVLEEVMNSLLSTEGDENCIFAIKSAYGSQDRACKSLKKQIIEHNFSIIDTPKISASKNRADLMLSLDAFETLYLDNPNIDRYCFMTSDSDFTVIADKLRKFGKQVWLVCQKQDKERAIISKAFDNLLFVEDFAPTEKSQEVNELDSLFVKAVKNMNQSKLPSNVSIANDKMKAIDPSFNIRKTKYRSFMELISEMETKKFISLERLDSGENRITDILV